MTSFRREQGGASVDSRYQLAATTLTALPGSQADGTVIRYKALATASGAQADVWWTLTYDAAAAYWYPQGAPLTSFVGAVADTTASTAYVAPTTVQEIVLPFAGDYLVAISSLLSNNTGGDGGAFSYAVGSTAASDTWCVATVAGGTNQSTHAHPYELHTGLLAGDKIAGRVKAFTGGTLTTNYRLINVLPLRVH